MFNFRLEYGNLFHWAEENYLKAVKGRDYKDEVGRVRHALSAVTTYARDLARKYPLQQEQVDHWYEVCKAQFPVYAQYWSKHPDNVGRVNLMTEQVFDVPYALPSGRVVRLRGKWDSVDLVGRGKEAGLYLMDHKTKGDVDERAIKRQLLWDLQTLFYLVAFQEWQRQDGSGVPVRSPEMVDRPLKGVRYNVIRRPLSGGKGSIVRHKATKNKPEESKSDFYARLKEIIEGAPEEFFMRWRTELTQGDIDVFKTQTLNPVLEQMCDWYECVTGCTGEIFDPCQKHGYVNWRHPYGIYSPMGDGRESDVDEYLLSGSTVGLERKTVMFPELG